MNGPGMPIKGDCPIAACCREKGHNECFTCGLKGECTNFRSRGMQPDFRKDKLTADAEEKEYIKEYAPKMAKWFTLLFWIMIFGNFAFLFTSTGINQLFPMFYMACSLVTGICTLIYGIIYFCMSSVHERYNAAGICAIINAVYHLIEIAVFRGGDTPTWFLVFIFGVYVAMYIEGYNFFNATSETLEGVDNILSAKWAELWKWYKWALIGTIGGVLFAIISALLGILILLASLICICVVDIIKFVYIFKTGKAFKSVFADLPEKKPEDAQ